MGEFREYRFTIAGALFLLMVFVTLCAGTGLAKSPLFWLPYLQDSGSNDLGVFLSALVTLLVTTFAAGFCCSTFAVCVWQGGSATEWQALRNSLGPNAEGWTNSERLDEAHVRFHSHAPNDLVGFCTRRLTAMWVGYNSFWALVFGYVGGLMLILIQLSDPSIRGQLQGQMLKATVALIVLLVVGAGLGWLLYLNANRARGEHWRAFCKFLAWDTMTHALPEQPGGSASA